MFTMLMTEVLVRERRDELLDSAARAHVARRLRGQRERAAPADQRPR